MDGAAAPDEETLTGGGPSRWSVAVAALVIALAVGVVAGYTAGHASSGRPRAAPTVTATVTRTAPTSAGPSAPSDPSPNVPVPEAGPVLGATGSRCATQHGRTLTLGVSVMNTSVAPAVLVSAGVSLPVAGGLRPGSVRIGTCNQVGPAVVGVNGYPLAPNASVSILLTVRVLVACPSAYPVQLRAVLTTQGHRTTQLVAAFDDLGDVSYSGCAPH